MEKLAARQDPRIARYPRVGPLQVLQSAAGYYIGRLYHYSADESGPYSRESGYIHDKETADRALIDNDYVPIL